MKFSTAAKLTHAKYVTSNQPAIFAHLKNAAVVVTIATHNTMISMNAQPGRCKPKKIHDQRGVPPKIARAEQFDGIIVLDLPRQSSNERVCQQLAQLSDLAPQQPRSDDSLYTGAEAKACCRLAALLDLPLTGVVRHVVPVAKTAAESVEKLSAWASGRCLDAEKAGIYQHQAVGGKRRLVRRPPISSVN